MFETIVHLKPKNQWRAGMTVQKVIAELGRVTKLPGVQGAWTMPIKARTVALPRAVAQEVRSPSW